MKKYRENPYTLRANGKTVYYHERKIDEKTNTFRAECYDSEGYIYWARWELDSCGKLRRPLEISLYQ